MRRKKEKMEEVYTGTQKQQCLKQWPDFLRKYQIICNIIRWEEKINKNKIKVNKR